MRGRSCLIHTLSKIYPNQSKWLKGLMRRGQKGYRPIRRIFIVVILYISSFPISTLKIHIIFNYWRYHSVLRYLYIAFERTTPPIIKKKLPLYHLLNPSAKMKITAERMIKIIAIVRYNLNLFLIVIIYSVFEFFFNSFKCFFNFIYAFYLVSFEA